MCTIIKNRHLKEDNKLPDKLTHSHTELLATLNIAIKDVTKSIDDFSLIQAFFLNDITFIKIYYCNMVF